MNLISVTFASVSRHLLSSWRDLLRLLFPGGTSQLGARDLRSPISTDALPWAARYFNAAFVDFENFPAIATAGHGSVLRALDQNFARLATNVFLG